MKASLRDTEIYFDVDGSGLVPDGTIMRARPVAFCIHGGPGGDHTAFKPLYSQLTADMQVVYFDHRGQGRSAPGDPAKYNLDENVEDMEALRQHLGLGPIVSIGNSYGGMVALAHAARYPKSVGALIVAATAAHCGFVARATEILRERGTSEQNQAYAALLSGHLKTPDDVRNYYAVLGPMYALKFDAAKAKETRDRSVPAVEPMNRAFAPDGFLRSFDLRTELFNITAPTLILAGRHDWICAPEFSKEIHDYIEGSELIIFEDSSHSLRVDQPDEVIGAIKAFVKRFANEKMD